MKTQPVLKNIKEKGQSLVELALVFTLLLFLITGILDLGIMFYTYSALRDTTQEGAIYGSTHPTETTLIQDHIKQSATSPIDASKIADIDINCGGSACITTTINSCQGQKITVDVNYAYKLVTPLIPAVIGRDTVVLTASVTDTILQSQETIEALKELPTPLVCP